MSTISPQILIFDSGFGGLSITKEILKKIPDCDISYLADNAFFPYGTKSETELLERVVSVIEKALQNIQPDIVIVACNTASTIALDELRRKFDIEFIGVVPAIKPAAEQSVSKSIGLLGTAGTVERQYTQQLIKDFAQDCRVHLYGSANLVKLAEDKIHGIEIEPQAVSRELEHVLTQDDNIDIVILACTHFPLLKQELENICGNQRPIKFIDSGYAIANRTKHLLASKDFELKHKNNTARINVLTTQKTNNTEIITENISAYLELAPTQIKTLN